MALIVLWITGLAALLLFIANVAVLASYINARWLRALACAVPAVVIFLLIAWANILPAMLLLHKILPVWPFPYFLSLLLAYVVGMVVILRRSGNAGKYQEGAHPAGRLWPLKKLGMALVIVLLMFVTTFWLKDLSIRQQLLIEQCSALNIKLSLAPQWVPDERNAAMLYRKAFALMDYKKLDRWTMDNDTEEAAFDPTTEEATAVLRECETALSMVRQGAEMSDCFWGEKYYGWRRFDSAPWGKCDLAVDLLSLEARVKAKQGDITGAYQTIVSIQRMCEHVSRFPDTGSLFFALAIDGTATGTLEDVIALSGGKIPDGMAPLFQREDNWRIKLVRSVKFEEAEWRHTYAEGMNSGEYGMGSNEVFVGMRVYLDSGAYSPRGILWRFFLVRHDIESSKERYNSYFGLLSVPAYESRAKMTRLEENICTEKWNGIADISKWLFISAEHSTVTLHEAQDCLRNLALTVMRYRQKNGAYPTALSDLVPALIPSVPLDPFDGQPIRYIRTDDGAVLYSIGDDQKDNNGAQWWRHFSGDGDDVTFCLGDAYTMRRLVQSRKNIEERRQHRAEHAAKKKEK